MLKRREFIALLGGAGAAAAFPLPLRAQQRSNIPRIGYVFSFTRAEGEQLWQACRQGLRELGYVEGRSIILEPRWADGRYERLPSIVADLLRLKVDLIVTAATPPTRAAMAATKTIPIVIVAVGEPVKGGIVASLARPGGNVTGLSLSTSDLSGKRLQLLMEVVRKVARKVARVAVLMNPDNPVSAVFLEETQLASRQLGIELQTFEVRQPNELERTFAAAAARRVDALTVFDDPALWSYRAQIVALAAEHRFPAMYGYRDFVDSGGLMSYGPDRPDQYRRTALYVDKILKGAKPSELPVEQPTKFELIVNRKTATMLGLDLPTSLLLRASEVIE